MTALTLELDAESNALIARHAAAAEETDAALWEAVQAAGVTGADYVAAEVQAGNTGLVARHGALGLAGQVVCWPIDRSALLVAVGVPQNSPAAVYAGIQDRGGLITPKKAKALAVPLTAEAARYESPRQMDGLTLLPRPGRPPLLVRMLKRPGKGGRTFIAEWVLVPSVRIRATGWFSRTIREAFGAMAEAFDATLGKYMRKWKRGTA